MNLHRLCVSCGGTGGHFYPGLAVAREWKRQGGEVLLLLGGKHADSQIRTAEGFGIPAQKIPAAPLAFSPGGLLKFAHTAFRGVLSCRRICRQFQPDALLAMGSFASFPPILAAKTLRIPVFLHDGNARLGKTNLRMSVLAKAMALAFPTRDEARCKCPTVLTGMPLRPELLQQKLTKAEAIAEINRRWHTDFSPERPTVLIFGGSLGAARINDSCRIPLDFPADAVQLIHLTGPDKFAGLSDYYRTAKFPHLLLESSPEMQLFYPAADWVICRAGGSTVSELACFGKYAMLVPYPYAAQDHQTDNAHYLTDSQGAELIWDQALTPDFFVSRLQAFLADPEQFREKGKILQSLAFPDASARVLNMIDSMIARK